MGFPIPQILSPALPTELLAYILQNESYPTTLIICAPRADFLTSLTKDNTLQEQQQPPPTHTVSLLTTPLLYRIATARHIRMVFVPTVSHLRAYLSVFSCDATDPSDKIQPPPATTGVQRPSRAQQPVLLVYGFLDLHRDTSEWSAQAISASAAALVEASRTSGLGAVIVEPPSKQVSDGSDASQGAVEDREGMLMEQVPVLSASVVRAGGDFDDAASWTGRKVTVSRVLGRWFRYKARHWSQDAAERE